MQWKNRYINKLEDLDLDFLFEAEKKEMIMQIMQIVTKLLVSQNLKKNFPKRNMLKLLNALQFITHVDQGKQAARKIKQNLLPIIQKWIRDQFLLFLDPIFEAICIIDCLAGIMMIATMELRKKRYFQNIFVNHFCNMNSKLILSSMNFGS